MTSIEHAFLASCGVMATGLYRRYGWQLVAAAGLGAVLPDWDGLTLLWSVPLFDEAHRTWGHGLLSCLLVSCCFATLDCRFDLMTRLSRLFFRLTRVEAPAAAIAVRPRPTWHDYLIWNLIVFLAGLSHLFADMIVSGAEGLSDWDIKIFWPFSERGLVYPLVPWGDIGILVLFILGMFAMLRWKERVRGLAGLTLILVALYAVIRGLF